MVQILLSKGVPDAVLLNSDLKKDLFPMATLLYNNRPALRPNRAFNSALNELLRDTLPAVNQPAKAQEPHLLYE